MTAQVPKPVLILVPGIQGRHEWMRPTIDALTTEFKVISFSLGDVPGPDFFPAWAAHLDRLVDAAETRTIVLVGISFGGLVATYYAAHHADRVSRLILVSTPSPRWRLDPSSAAYTRYPRLALPLFACRGALRLAPEIRAGFRTWHERLYAAAEHLSRVVRWPMSPSSMAAWVAAWSTTDIGEFCRSVTAPTLVVTGEPHLDRVVPVSSSLEYLTLIPGASHVTLPRSGHLGFLLHPSDFAAVVGRFAGQDFGPPTITPRESTHPGERQPCQ